ncbi:MAG: site-specific integrase [Planctomycetia bacterium]|nr:site-specific integrase [Planctomycetia bacterium]
MPKLVNRTPKYSRHRRSGQAFVRLEGKQVQLGPWSNDPNAPSRHAYNKIVGEWIVNGRMVPRTATGSQPLTINECILRYSTWAEAYYEGRTDSIKVACRFLRKTYGTTSAQEFGPLALQVVIAKMVEQDLSRGYVCDLIGRMKRFFRWCTAQQLITASVIASLECVSSPRKGKGEARETLPVVPVDDAIVDATLPHVPPTIGDMIRLQRLCGMRPGELCQLRPCDVNRVGDVWSYRPEHHKTEHRGRDRRIAIGPLGQAILAPYLDRDPDAYCFVPCEVVAAINAEKRKNPDLAKRRRVRKPRRLPGQAYTEDSFRRAVARGCEEAFGMPDELRLASSAYSRAVKLRKENGTAIPAALQSIEDARREAARDWRERFVWSPNQLRHSAATSIRAKFGLEAAANVLGHARADVTQVYAERDWKTAERVAREVG